MSMLFTMLGKLTTFLPPMRKKKTTLEILEHIECKIKEYEKYKQSNEQKERKYIGALVLYSIVFYILGALVCYIYFMPTNLVDRIKMLAPFFITPLLIYFIRRFLKWFFIKRTSYYEKKLADLKDEKKQILEEVKEKETYKKAREILDRFSGSDINITPPESPNSLSNNVTSPFGMNNTLNMSRNPNGTMLVHRNLKQQSQDRQIAMMNISTRANQNESRLNQTQAIKQLPLQTNAGNQGISQQQMTSSTGNKPIDSSNKLTSTSGPAVLLPQAKALLPRPIIAPNRTIFDKILDYIIGEGPNNRYALICKSCHFHNGMALKEEFEFVAFRCAYCLFYNEARKSRPLVPKLNQVKSNTESNLNESVGGSSTLSSSNSLDDLNTLSDPISSSDILKTKINQNAILTTRKNSLTELSNKKMNPKERLQMNKSVSKSMDMLNKNENKEN